MYLFQPVQSFIAIIDARRKIHVKDYYIDSSSGKQGSYSVRIGRSEYLAEFSIEQEFERSQHTLIIIYYKYGSGFHRYDMKVILLKFAGKGIGFQPLLQACVQ